MLHVIIVGAGIAGLSAGLSLRRAGHIVHIYERSGMNNEVGAAINVPPNAIRFLIPWGLDPVRCHFVKSRRMTYTDPMTMEITMDMSLEGSPARYDGYDLWLAHRVDLHDSLKNMAIDPEGPGIPVTIHIKSDVIGYDPSTPSITLGSGETIRADIIVGADGVHSLASETVLGRKNHPQPPSHYNYCYRFLIAAAVLEEDAETRYWNVNGDGMFRLFPHNETNRRLVSYPCRDNAVHNFVGIFHEDKLDCGNGDVKEDYQATVDKSAVIQKFSDFHPSLLAIINKATDIKRWPLLYRPPIPTWRKERLVLTGDAAHPMLPHQGQGGAQGLEDGLVLGIVLCGAVTADQIEERLSLYEKIRRNRASAIQILSNVGQDQSHLVREELMQYMEAVDIPTNPAESLRFCYTYDVVQAAIEAVKELDSSFELRPGFFAANEASSVGV